ncbi:MAG: 30S ribosomal protein S17 [Patescibacteria group bacterium]|nr:30S ribosomal protein S17 [Patescibacteria group bacterium]
MEKQVSKRKLEGTVVSDKMDKTVVVEVTALKVHSKYKKRYKSSKKYKAHDEKNQYKVGDFVVIQECRPLSKDKRWRVIKVVNNK